MWQAVFVWQILSNPANCLSGLIRQPSRHGDALQTLYYTNNIVTENSTLAAKPVCHNIWQPTCDCNMGNAISMACH